ncbi:MAG TPA: ThiF family adenylyltransferase [Vicinamibacterales bacterium]|nr:ThiF family adenylyltransferase [Vicinamibacterales bacterium]
MTTERYARHSLIDWFDQDAVKAQRLVVVGAGAVGNEVIKDLVLLGAGAIDVFDWDLIEVHNLTRSVLFRERDIGRPKAEAAAERARELDPSVCIEPHVGDFWSTLTLSGVERATAVFCCVDNFEARIRLNRVCAIVGTPLLNVGIDSRFAVVERFPFSRDRRVPCYECGLPPSAYAEIAKRYSCGGLKRVAVAERKVPTTILTSSAAASLAVSMHLRAPLDGLPGSSWRHFQDTFTGHTTTTELTPLDGCAGCGDLQHGRIVVGACRPIEPRLAIVRARAPASPVRFSDRVVTHVRCVVCDANDPGERIFRVADRYDETLAACPACGERTREVGLREQFDYGELLRDYAGRDLPGKFIVTTLNDGIQVVIELKGEDHVRGEGDSTDGRQDSEGGGDDAA